MQVAYGPRPAGSAAERQLAHRLRSLLPGGRFETVPGGLRNVVGVVRGRDPRRYVVVGAHLWSLLRDAARASGTAAAFPAQSTGGFLDDYTPFERAGVPSIDVIDCAFPCWHRTCDA